MSDGPGPTGPAPLAPGAILGAGLDLASVPLVRQAVKDFGQRYLSRVFTPDELTYCLGRPDPAQPLAAAFAAKEATIKALGVDGPQPPWTSIALRRHQDGACELRLTGLAGELATKQGVHNLHVSVSHTGELAIAAVVATGTL